jgi:hypothetical protein
MMFGGKRQSVCCVLVLRWKQGRTCAIPTCTPPPTLYKAVHDPFHFVPSPYKASRPVHNPFVSSHLDSSRTY